MCFSVCHSWYCGSTTTTYSTCALQCLPPVGGTSRKKQVLLLSHYHYEEPVLFFLTMLLDYIMKLVVWTMHRILVQLAAYARLPVHG
jgi:hypothetical protein